MRRLYLSSVLAFVLAAPASAADPPDLEQVAPYDARVVQRGERWYLGFATAVRNVGPGGLRIRGQGARPGTMAAHQLSEDGLQVLAPAVGMLRYVTTYGHGHWHLMQFMRYELRGLDVPGQLLDRKQGFCLGDAPFVDGWCARDKPWLTTTDVGIRPGGIDIYEPNVEGQELAIGPAITPSGRYVLTSRIGPTGRVQETRTDNNAASTVIELRWPLRHGQAIAALGSCLGEGCAGAVPPPPALRRMRASDARRLARRALRRQIGRLAGRARIRCRPARTRGACRVALRRDRVTVGGSVRVWYVAEGAATRWRYSLDVRRLMRGCRSACSRRIRIVDRRGGTVPPRAAGRVTGTGG
jgi:Lysyl oxidase